MLKQNRNIRPPAGRFRHPAGVESESHLHGLEQDSDSPCRHVLVTGRGEDACRVTGFMAGKILFVEGRPETDCSRRVAFGHSRICTCPVRKRLFQLHGV